MRSLGLLLIAVVVVGMAALTPVKHQPSEESTMRFPPFNYDGPYNVNASEIGLSSRSVFCTADNLPELSEHEFDEVYHAVRNVFDKYGSVAGVDRDFFVYDDKYFDRTQKIEVSSKVSGKVIIQLVRDLQEALQQYVTWRVAIIGPTTSNVIIVYPTAVRIAPNADGSSRTLEDVAVSWPTKM